MALGDCCARVLCRDDAQVVAATAVQHAGFSCGDRTRWPGMGLCGAAALASWTALRTASAILDVAVQLGRLAWRHASPTIRRWRAAPLRFTFAGALGGFARHGVGRDPRLSAQEACHRRTAVEQTNSLRVHVILRIHFLLFRTQLFTPSARWSGVGIMYGRAWARTTFCRARLYWFRSVA